MRDGSAKVSAQDRKALVDDKRSPIEQLMSTLRTLGEEIEPHLHLVSDAARDEWRSFVSRWRSDGQLRDGGLSLAGEGLRATEAKVRRFRDIVHALAHQTRSPGPIHPVAPTEEL